MPGAILPRRREFLEVCQDRIEAGIAVERFQVLVVRHLIRPSITMVQSLPEGRQRFCAMTLEGRKTGEVVNKLGRKLIGFAEHPACGGKGLAKDPFRVGVTMVARVCRRKTILSPQ